MSTKPLQRSGDWVKPEIIRAYNRTGTTLTYGEMVALDLTGADTDSQPYATWLADTDPLPSKNPFQNAILPATAHLTGWIFGVCQDLSVADNAPFNLMLKGITKISMTSGAVVIGDKLMGANGVKTVLKSTDGNTQVALAIQANGSAAGLFWCLFGLHAYAAGAAS